MAGVHRVARGRRASGRGDLAAPAPRRGSRVLNRFLPIGVGLVVALTTFLAVEAVDDDPAPRQTTAATAPGRTAADRGRSLFARMGCGTCHRLAAANSQGQIGPDLDTALAGYDRAALQAKIVNPGSTVMPADFGERMNARELGDLVTFLLAARR